MTPTFQIVEAQTIRETFPEPHKGGQEPHTDPSDTKALTRCRTGGLLLPQERSPGAEQPLRIRQAASGPQPSLTPSSRNCGDVRETPASSLSTCPGRSALHASDTHARQQVHIVVGPISQVGTRRKTRATSPESRGGWRVPEAGLEPTRSESHSVPPGSPSAGWGPGDKRQEQRRHLGSRVSGVSPPVTSQGRQEFCPQKPPRDHETQAPTPYTPAGEWGFTTRPRERPPDTKLPRHPGDSQQREKNETLSGSLPPRTPSHPLTCLGFLLPPSSGPPRRSVLTAMQKSSRLSLQPPARTGGPGQLCPPPPKHTYKP